MQFPKSFADTPIIKWQYAELTNSALADSLKVRVRMVTTVRPAENSQHSKYYNLSTKWIADA